MQTPKTILITGATSGIGAELAKQYSAVGVTLYLCARRQELLEQVAAVCREKGAEISIYTCDVTDKEKMRTWVLACDEASPLDLVIANAGVGGLKSLAGNFGEPEEVAAAAAFLLSDEASYITATCLSVDGGKASQLVVPPPLVA